MCNEMGLHQQLPGRINHIDGVNISKHVGIEGF